MVKRSILFILVLVFLTSYAEKDCPAFTQNPNIVSLVISGNYVPQPNYDCKKVIVNKDKQKRKKDKTNKNSDEVPR